jgi:hypothetical protein
MYLFYDYWKSFRGHFQLTVLVLVVWDSNFGNPQIVSQKMFPLSDIYRSQTFTDKNYRTLVLKNERLLS